MENAVTERQKLLDAYFAASDEYTVTFQAWLAAPIANKENLLATVCEAKIRLDIACTTWKRFHRTKNLATNY